MPMTIPKAIEILTEPTETPIHFFTIDQHDALKLGIEALKRVREYRPDMGGNDDELLPGETKV